MSHAPYTEQNLAAALAHARADIPIFPAFILRRFNGAFAKKPVISNWQEQATTNEALIKFWFNQYPQAVPGIELGRAGLVVLDPDRHANGPDGMEAFAQLLSDVGELPQHPTAKTPQGFHHYFTQPNGSPLGNSPGGLPAGIDVRGAGGWTVAPGAVRIDGEVYSQETPSLAEAYVAHTIPPLPDAIVRLITEGHRNGPRAADAGSTRRQAHDPYTEPLAEDGGRLDVEAALAAMRPGNVNATHCRVIGSLLSQGVPYEEIVEKIVTATMHMAVMLELKDWTREAEFKFVRDCMVGLLKGRCQKEQSPSPAPIWVATELAEAWDALVEKGDRPLIFWRGDTHSWVVRGMAWAWDRKKQQGTGNSSQSANKKSDAPGDDGSTKAHQKAGTAPPPPLPRIHSKAVRMLRLQQDTATGMALRPPLHARHCQRHHLTRRRRQDHTRPGRGRDHGHRAQFAR
jgi:hypothetical protein